MAPAARLAGLLACSWTQQVDGPLRQRILPDGCVDLIWFAGRELLVAGPATGPAVAALPPRSTTVGVRWRPGAGGAALGLPLDALRDETVPLAELWGADAADALAERLAAAPEPARVSVLEAVVAERARLGAGREPDRLALEACRAVGAAARAGRRLDVAGLADTLGVSERQLLRRFHAAVGYGPRTLARVLRFRRFLTAVWERPAQQPAPDLAWLAAEVGYADQAHLARDCRRLAGVTPSQLLAGD